MNWKNIYTKVSQFLVYCSETLQSKSYCLITWLWPLTSKPLSFTINLWALTSIVSDPTHSRYGHHLSGDQVSELVKPSDETFQQVHDWLLNHNITESQLRYSPAKDWIKVSLHVESIERLLDSEYSVFKHEDGVRIVRTPQWSLPFHLHEHIATIQPTNSFFQPRSQRSTIKTASIMSEQPNIDFVTDATATTSSSSVCNSSAVTSLCLRTLYGLISSA